MAYHEISIMDLWEIIRRWHDRQGIRQIARSLGYDRKTVQRYIRLATSRGLKQDTPLPPKEKVMELFQSVEPNFGRSPQAQSILSPYLDEINQLINDTDLSLRPKNAFLVLCQRHALTEKVSYSSFRRFLLTHRIDLGLLQSTCRLEVNPGAEVQIDYGRMCLLFDPETLRFRQLYAFIATLSHSRMKYVELTFRQDQTSFVSSHVRMFEFFGGVPERLLPDNLKAGVIKPDLYDPTFNRSYREMAEHYDCFIDPARIHRPKDKAKVERDVQTVRQAVRMQIALNPSITLAELNHAIKGWLLQEYGQRTHGTTREKPMVVFAEREKPALKPLPVQRFEAAIWKQATVHPDHYIQFNGKAFSVPTSYVTKKVWIRASENTLRVFYNERLIAQHVITRSYRHTDYTHFPENLRAVIDRGTLHRSLLDRASRIGEDFHDLIRRLLEIHAYMNLRRAQGLVSVAEDENDHELVNRAARLMHEYRVRETPRDMRAVMEKLRIEDQQKRQASLFAEASQEYVRDITYFINNQEGQS